jgi:hypothetical protein
MIIYGHGSQNLAISNSALAIDALSLSGHSKLASDDGPVRIVDITARSTVEHAASGMHTSNQINEHSR